MEYRCSYCKEGYIKKEDIPCKCPSCGRFLSRLLAPKPQWVQDVEDKEDKEFFDSIEKIIKNTDKDKRTFKEIVDQWKYAMTDTILMHPETWEQFLRDCEGYQMYTDGEKEILNRLESLERLFLETVNNDCEEPEIIDKVFNHYHKKMGGKLSLEKRGSDWDAKWWSEEEIGDQEPLIWACAISPIRVLRCAYQEWKERQHETAKRPDRE